jgi:uncharacterized protein YjbJ (UPF0337 family)
MNEERIAGNAEWVAGKVQEGVGRLTGDAQNQVQGRVKQAEGTIQDLYGQAKQTASDAADMVRAQASDMDDVLRTAIEQRPYTTAAIALGIGYLIGRFAHWES